MNERIQQMIYSLNEKEGVHWINEDKIKFAELIVRECAGLAKTKSDFIGDKAMKYSEDTDEETSALATAWQFLVFEQEIKKHFGVES